MNGIINFNTSEPTINPLSLPSKWTLTSPDSILSLLFLLIFNRFSVFHLHNLRSKLSNDCFYIIRTSFNIIILHILLKTIIYRLGVCVWLWLWIYVVWGGWREQFAHNNLFKWCFNAKYTIDCSRNGCQIQYVVRFILSGIDESYSQTELIQLGAKSAVNINAFSILLSLRLFSSSHFTFWSSYFRINRTVFFTYGSFQDDHKLLLAYQHLLLCIFHEN